MPSTNKYGPAPIFKYITDESRRAPLIMLRSAVAPLLDNNILTHFTDHSVFHSDSLVEIVDKLIEPLQNDKNRLNDQELIILYSACYLHDIGMHNEMAGNTLVIHNAINNKGYGQKWNELQPSTKIELIRLHHAQIAAEMIGKSVREKEPMVGIQLLDIYDPDRVAAICEAHCIDFGSNRYIELVQEGPEIRMNFLAGLLRVADILDETRPRALRAKARILELDLESKIHWWRHYYTESVTFDTEKRQITLWFDFPHDKIDEYSKVIPQLQKPWIEAELTNQASSFGRYGLYWILSTKISHKVYGNAEIMPDEVFGAMLRELYRRRLFQAEEQRIAILEHFEEAQPFIRRRLDELNEIKDGMQPNDYIHAVSNIADDMWNLGAKRSAWITLQPVYMKYKGELGSKEQVEIGIKLSKMMMMDENESSAVHILSELKSVIEKLNDDNQKYRYWELIAQCYFDNCINDTPEAIEMAIKYAPDMHSKESLLACLAEWHFLQTNLSDAVTIAQKTCEAK